MIDPRGQRFAATLATVVLAVVLLTGSYWLLLVQAGVFAVGVLAGPAATPYAWLYRTAVRPRLAPPTELEAAEPPRFAQLCGLAFSAVALLGAVIGSGVPRHRGCVVRTGCGLLERRLRLLPGV